MSNLLAIVGELIFQIIEVYLFIKYIFIQKITITKRKLFLSCSMFAVCVAAYAVESKWTLLLYLGMLSIFMLIIEGNWFRRVSIFLSVWFFISYINTFFCVMCSFIGKESVFTFIDETPQRYVQYVLGIILIAIVGFIVDKRETWEVIWWKIDGSVFAILSLCELFSFFYIMSSFDLAKQYEGYVIQNLVVLGGIGSGIAITVVVVVLYVVNILKVHYKNESKLKDEFLKVSKDYCKELLENDHEIRKMRHDMRGHITAIESLIEQKKYVELTDYIGDMNEEMNKQTYIKATGNEMLDAILAKYTPANKDIVYDIDGRFNCDKIKDYDLCILFSNLISNAIEACSHIEGRQKILGIKFKEIGENFLIVVSNPVEGDVDIERFGKFTTKDDKENHGYGIQRMLEVVEKYNGSIDFRQEKNNVIATVILS